MFIRSIITFFIILSPAYAIESALNAEQWLEKISQSMKVSNYQGTVAFFKNGRLDTMKYSHMAKQGVEQERLLSLNSPMREVIRSAGTVSCIFKEPEKVVVNHQPVSASFLLDLPDDFTRLTSIYRFSIQGDESVAMRQAVMIAIDATDNYRYARKVWIDKQDFLPLKVEVYDSKGKTLEQIVFTDLQVNDTQTLIETEKKFANKTIEHIQQSEQLSFDQADFVLENIPSGFEIVFFTRTVMDSSEQSVEHLLLSDGFSSVSVYREAFTDEIQAGVQNLGSVNSYTKVFGESLITALGEVPADTVKSIVNGVKFR